MDELKHLPLYKAWRFWVLLGAVALLLFALAWSGRHRSVPTTASKETASKEQTPPGFLVYQDKEVGFQFAYPQQWGTIERQTVEESSTYSHLKYSFSNQPDVTVSALTDASFYYHEIAANQNLPQSRDVAAYCSGLLSAGISQARTEETGGVLDVYGWNGIYNAGQCGPESGMLNLAVKTNDEGSWSVYPPRTSLDSNIALTKRAVKKLSAPNYVAVVMDVTTPTLDSQAYCVHQLPGGDSPVIETIFRCINHAEKALIDERYRQFDASVLGRQFLQSARSLTALNVDQDRLSQRYATKTDYQSGLIPFTFQYPKNLTLSAEDAAHPGTQLYIDTPGENSQTIVAISSYNLSELAAAIEKRSAEQGEAMGDPPPNLDVDAAIFDRDRQIIEGTESGIFACPSGSDSGFSKDSRQCELVSINGQRFIKRMYRLVYLSDDLGINFTTYRGDRRYDFALFTPWSTANTVASLEEASQTDLFLKIGMNIIQSLKIRLP